MVTPKIYNELDDEERKLWHSHVFEVKSGMLIMPAPASVPDAVWEVAENKEMEEVVHLYGKCGWLSLLPLLSAGNADVLYRQSISALAS